MARLLLIAFGIVAFIGSSCPMQRAMAMETVHDHGDIMSHDAGPLCPAAQEEHVAHQPEADCEGGHCMGMRADKDEAIIETQKLVIASDVPALAPALVHEYVDTYKPYIITSPWPPGGGRTTVILRC